MRPVSSRLSHLSLLCFGLLAGLVGVVYAQPVQDGTDAAPPRLGILVSNGVLVTDVQKGSGGDRLGLQKLDIIFKINGTPVDSPSSLPLIMANRRADQPMSLLIYRMGKPMVLSVNSLLPDPKIVKGPDLVAPPRPQPIIGPEETDLKSPPKADFVKAQLTKVYEASSKIAFPTPEKVTVSFDSLSIGDVRTDDQVTIKGKAASYSFIKARVVIHETYPEGVEYAYQYDASYYAILLQKRWNIISAERMVHLQ